MDRREFNRLVMFLTSCPEDAARLADVLKAGLETRCTWVGTEEAAKVLDKSPSWVKAHRGLFPSAMETQSGAKVSWKFKKEELLPAYEEYLRGQQLRK